MKKDFKISKKIQTIIEEETGNIYFITMLSMDAADWAAALSRNEAGKVFNNIRDMLRDVETSRGNIATGWPEGKKLTKSFSNLSNILNAWLSNFRAWQNLVSDHADNKIKLDDDFKNKYQQFVIRNRDFRSQINTEFIDVESILSDLGIDTQAIVSRSNEKISNSKLTQQARAEAQTIFDELLESERIPRDRALAKLANYMDLPPNDINIQSFTMSECGSVITWAKEVRVLGI